ncbi:MAG: hypothetical protein COX88_01530 [Candidatus Nealsonbacteria bacterium CG_4_10_14_0_2_um_filter_35_20]|nr:MAG: hypothetical protein COX88_01530 [Candidatus Nealsonbacteria bacterium CG_4_10_14_0_2_um_filter_35_20]
MRRGKPIKIIDNSGYFFRIPFFEKIIWPAQSLEYKRRSFTSRGIEKEGWCDLTKTIAADVSIYFTLPTENEELFWVAKTIPLEQEKCKEFLEKPVLDAIRDVGKEKTYVEWIEDRRDIEEKAVKRLLSDRKSPFYKARIPGISVDLKNITVR